MFMCQENSPGLTVHKPRYMEYGWRCVKPPRTHIGRSFLIFSIDFKKLFEFRERCRGSNLIDLHSGPRVRQRKHRDEIDCIPTQQTPSSF
ncbi:hypothetical protein PGT21_011136 [Puccinia graminis f. sp. tritici]|uniref:Uncharacterized protein n=1 Tax=Puccinia graminis f. sp. tritici TaxID=56615 RepID=A0A5B0MBN7_PUCGR|nr:hypothetical protein PGT21_011136 [Puccinia graminis f. sp. tritici]KAA1122001.1 hypothetical protein PGTUg99_017304 [Puccinia graminis f. sp. tritici]